MKKIPELVHELENRCMKNWEKLNKNFVIDEIENFADNTKEMGKKFKINILIKWADSLKSQVQNFDMENMPLTLNSFPDLVKTIKSFNDLHNVEKE